MSKLPRSWTLSTFGELNRFESRTLDPSTHPNETFDLYSVPSFPSSQPERVMGSQIGSTKQTVAPDDVLVCKINPRINRTWHIGPKGEHELIASSEWIGFRSEALQPRFANHYFASPSFRELLCSEVAGVGGSLTRAQPKKVATYPVPVAPLAEQTRIADELDKLLASIQSCNDRLDAIPALLNRFRQAVLTAAIKGDLIEGIAPSDWRQCTVGDVLEAKPRNGYSPKAVDFETSVRSLTLSATTSGRFLAQHSKFIDEQIPDGSHLWLEPGDILIQRANTLEYVGVSAIFDGSSKQFIYPDLMMKCRPNQLILRKFLFYTLSAEQTRQYFRDQATGTAGNMPKINQQTVMSAPVFLPSLEEQERIVLKVDALFQLADRIEARHIAASTQAQRLSPLLLAKAFRGELVPQDPNDEPASALLERIMAEREKAATQPRTRKSSAGRKLVRAPKENATMTKSRQDEDVQGQPYLARHLRLIGGTAPAEALFKASELPVADFYKQLAWEVANGHLRDGKTVLELGDAA